MPEHVLWQGFQSLQVTVKGTGGHSSRPPLDASTVRAALGSFPQPVCTRLQVMLVTFCAKDHVLFIMSYMCQALPALCHANVENFVTLIPHVWYVTVACRVTPFEATIAERHADVQHNMRKLP